MRTTGIVQQIKDSKPDSRKAANIYPAIAMQIVQPEDPEKEPYGYLSTLIRKEHEGKFYLIPIVRAFHEIPADTAILPPYDKAHVENEADILIAKYQIDPERDILDKYQKA